VPKITKMKLPTWISVIGASIVNAETPCVADNADDCATGSACKWDNGSCTVQAGLVSVDSAADLLNAALANTSPARSGAIEATSQLNLIGLQMMQSSDLLAGLNLKDWLPYGQNNFMTSFMAPGGFLGNQLANQYYTCPLDVPFCARKACTAHFDAEKNAYSCYSDPGCCFDQNLYLHKQMFGVNFYKTVPVCYRAVDNPLFNQLAQEVTASGVTFNPAYISPIVNKVLTFIRSPITYPALRQYMQCAPQDKTYQSYQFLSNLQTRFPTQATTINWMMTKDNYFDDLISVITPTCGWSQITQEECVMAGCCWSGKNTCLKPLRITDITEDQLNTAINHINFLKFVDATAATKEAKALDIKNMIAAQAMNGNGLNNPLVRSILPGMDLQEIMKYSFLMNPGSGSGLQSMAMFSALNNQPINFGNAAVSNLSQFAQLAALTGGNKVDPMSSIVDQWAAQSLGIDPNTLWMIRNQKGDGTIKPGANLDFGIGIPESKNPLFTISQKMVDFFKTQALLGGKTEFGDMFGFQSSSTCPADDVSINCMQPSNHGLTDFINLHKEKAACEAKGCCWDQSRQNNNNFGLTRFTCSWNPEWSIYGKFSFLPSLTKSLRGCCGLSACVQQQGRTAEAAPVAPVEPAAPVAPAAPVVDTPVVAEPEPAPVVVEEPVDAGIVGAKYSPWKETSCTVSCGGGLKNKYRDCISGCSGLRYKRQFEHNIPCNESPCALFIPAPGFANLFN